MSRLIVFVNNYPYGFGEPFFHDELGFLSSEFDRVLIVSKNKDISGEILFSREDNKNIEFINLGEFKRLKINSISNLFVLFFKEFKLEKNKIKSYSHLKYFLAFLLNSYRYKILIQNNIEVKTGDLIYTYWLDELTFSLLQIKKEFRQNLNVITRCHGWDVYEFRDKLNYLPLRNRIYQSIDNVFTISDNANQYIREKYSRVNKNKIQTFRLGVNDYIQNDSNLLERQINQFNILSFSTFSTVKNIELLINSLEIINDISLVWYHIGDGLFQNEYEKQIYDLIKTKLECKFNLRVCLLGFLSHEEIITFFKSTYIDLMISTSKYEGIPVTMMEAMSFSIPVIATNVGGVGEIVNNDNGFIISPKVSEIEIADKIIEYISFSESKKKSIRENARQTFLTKFNATNNYQKFSNYLKNMNNQEYKQCTKCLFDNKVYPNIVFDFNGVCDVCHTYDKLSERKVLTKLEGENKLNDLLVDVKSSGMNKKYDCILGVSGGVDSSYLMVMMKEWGLRPLIIHVDNGWNSELAVANIENLVLKLGFDLFTHVLNWTEMKDLQLAFFKSSVIDIDIPFDNACWKKVFQLVNKYNVKYLFSGHNTVTEGWMPDSFVHYKLDKINIKDIHKKFGNSKLKNITFLGPIELFYYQKIRRIKFVTPLDYIKYDKREVIEKLENEYGWRPYGNKHYENIFTRFYQGYILPKKFNVDKRISHLSTLICSGQLTKEKALIELKNEIYDPKILEEDKLFFIKKMSLNESEFEQIMNFPIKKHTEYRSYLNVYTKLGFVKKIIKFFIGKNEL